MTTLPILEPCDVLVLGGSTGAVQAALSAASRGARVLLVTSFTYLGEDVASHLRYWLEPGQAPATPLAADIFAATLESGRPLTPMQMKYPLEQALLRQNIRFLYMTYPAWLLRNERGAIAGAVVANRSGFQAIVARVIIDATERSLAGRMSRAEFRPFPAGTCHMERTVLGGAALEIPGASAHTRTTPMLIGDREVNAVTYSLPIDMPDASPASFCAAETRARLLTWHPDQATASDRLFFLAPDRLKTARGPAGWTDADSLPLPSLQCDTEPLFLLGSGADLTEPALHHLMQPCNLMAVGARLGQHAAELAAATPAAAAWTVDYHELPAVSCSICRADAYFRLADARTIAIDLQRVPVLADCDVLVAGGGTGGAPAGIAAARAGARTIVLEYLPCLGGVGTAGRIASYYHGNRCGFTLEIDRGVHAMGPHPEFECLSGKWNTEWKQQYLLAESARAGASVWLGTLTAAAAVEGSSARGVVAMTPFGFGLVRAGTVVDATGSADVAAAAGAPTVTLGRAHVAVQGTGLPPFIPGRHYTNTDHTFVDETDVMDITRAFVVAREKFREGFDLAQMVDTRERRQVVGVVRLDPLDFLAKRTLPDTVVTAMSNFDSHGFTIHPLFMARPPDRESIRAQVPFRALLPATLDNLIVTGLGVSAHRDALPVIRMIPDVQNQGYAAGRAAAMAACQGIRLRNIDIKDLQRHLIDIGNLEPDVIRHEDSFPLPDAAIAEAVRTGMDDHLGLAMIFARPATSRPLLQEAWRTAPDPHLRLRYAHVLGLMGDATGLETLLAELPQRDWDKGWNYTGMGQFGFSLSEVDSLLVALARTGDTRAGPVIVDKIRQLRPDHEFSHFRAAVLACESVPSKEAAPLLARLLDDPAVAGNSKPDLAAAVRSVPASGTDTTERNRELKELMLARGLFACGDADGRGRRVLEAYRRDLHGHYARHATAILDAVETSGFTG